MNHRVGRSVFALVVGLVVAYLSHEWITNPESRALRQAEERAVLAARELLVARVGTDSLEIVDPLAPRRKVGKVYVYAESPGWAVSGYYRRDDGDAWHPYLVYLAEDLTPHSFKAEDAALDLK